MKRYKNLNRSADVVTKVILFTNCHDYGTIILMGSNEDDG